MNAYTVLPFRLAWGAVSYLYAIQRQHSRLERGLAVALHARARPARAAPCPPARPPPPPAPPAPAPRERDDTAATATPYSRTRDTVNAQRTTRYAATNPIPPHIIDLGSGSIAEEARMRP